ncbi:hypothetical protein [Streptomyces sp. NPDC002990]
MTIENIESSTRPTWESRGDERDEGRGPATEDEGGALLTDHLAQAVRDLLAAR